MTRLLNRLLWLYPARWRDRYGAELDQLVHDLRPSSSTAALAVDLARGALDAHLQEGAGVPATDRRAIRRGILIAGIVWIGLSIEVVLTNVVFPTTTDEDTVPVLVSYLCVFAAMFLVGLLAARDGAGRRGVLLAGFVTGALIGALTVGTFAVVDNVWLDVVRHQQAKITGYAQSGAGSMRRYINDGLIGAAVVLTLGLGVFGALFSLAGGLARRQPQRGTAADGEP